MSKDILGMYGPGNKSGPRATNGGIQPVKEISYKDPVGPKGIMGNARPGLGGTNHGCCGTQGKR